MNCFQHIPHLIYNQLNIRMDKWEEKDSKVIWYTSRTTYFDSLVTNRAIDFLCNTGVSVRDRFAYGPFIMKLEDSKLSNHLGFNGFVESSDGYIPIIKRSKSVSIGKDTYGNSIGASLKTKYALTNETFCLKGLENGIINEIYDELKIPSNQLEEFSLNKNLISAYRDMVEGGKPQLLFYAKSKMSKGDIEANFKEIISTKKCEGWDKQEIELEDGTKILWIPIKDWKEIYLAPDYFGYAGKAYKIMPSASASMLMFMHYLEKNRLGEEYADYRNEN